MPFLGYLLANIAFEPLVDATMAGRLIHFAGRLSYRQLCLLSLVAQADDFALPSEGAVRRYSGIEWIEWAVHRELDDLSFGGLEFVEAPKSETKNLRLQLPTSTISEMRPVREGLLLFHLMCLDRVDRDDLNETAARLWANYEPQPTAPDG